MEGKGGEVAKVTNRASHKPYNTFPKVTLAGETGHLQSLFKKEALSQPFD